VIRKIFGIRGKTADLSESIATAADQAMITATELNVSFAATLALSGMDSVTII